MSRVTCHISISLDGFVAGPNQSMDNPIGEGGMRLHEWLFGTDSWREQHGLEGGERSADADVVDEVVQGVGAYIMGRKMFGGGGGPWDETWTSWWGEDPPYHAPVFVLTHHSHIVPIILGSGERLLEHVGDPTLQPIDVVASPAVTHVKYRVVR